MTARTPLYYDGNNLVEMSAAEIVEYQRQAIFQYASNPSVTLTVVSNSGAGFDAIDDTRFKSSAAAQQNSSHPGSGSLQTTTTSFDKLNSLARYVFIPIVESSGFFGSLIDNFLSDCFI